MVMELLVVIRPIQTEPLIGHVVQMVVKLQLQEMVVVAILATERMAQIALSMLAPPLQLKAMAEENLILEQRQQKNVMALILITQ